MDALLPLRHKTLHRPPPTPARLHPLPRLLHRPPGLGNRLRLHRQAPARLPLLVRRRRRLHLRCRPTLRDPHRGPQLSVGRVRAVWARVWDYVWRVARGGGGYVWAW